MRISSYGNYLHKTVTRILTHAEKDILKPVLQKTFLCFFIFCRMASIDIVL